MDRKEEGTGTGREDENKEQRKGWRGEGKEDLGGEGKRGKMVEGGDLVYGYCRVGGF